MTKSDSGENDGAGKQAVRDARDHVLAAKTAMERILEFFESTITDDPGKLSIYSDDVRASYMAVDSAWQMLWLLVEDGGDEGIAGKARGFLADAETLQARALSTLDSYRGTDTDAAAARHLKSEYGFAGKKAIDAVRKLLDEAAPAPEKPPDVAPGKRLVVHGPRDIELLCEVCGKWSMKFRDDEMLGHSGFMFSGVTKRCFIDEKYVERIIELLLADDLATLHRFVWDISWSLEDGLGGYCPTCDKTYCREHMYVQEVWDEGFYDFSWGTCPEGHKRCIDD